MALHAFAAVLKAADSIKYSTSGGVFSALAEGVLTKGGLVFGASFDEKIYVWQHMWSL